MKSPIKKFQIQEIIEFPINTGSFDPTQYDLSMKRSWPGVTWKYVYRCAEELRNHYRALLGVKHYRVKVESRRCEFSGPYIARIVVAVPKA